MTLYSTTKFIHNIRGRVPPLTWLGKRTSSTSVLIPLLTQLENILNATKNIEAPLNWKPERAHFKHFTPSVSMLIWANVGNNIAKITSRQDCILSDKKKLIEKFSVLHEKGIISLSNDISLVAEGCDNGNYLPLLSAALTRDGKNRVIRPFLINGSDVMINKACRAAYCLFHKEGQNKIYGDICNAFDCFPSELDKFKTSQKIFTPFRMGAVGSHREIKTYLTTRMPLMNNSGFCCYCLLLDTSTTRNTLSKEYGHNVLIIEGNKYTELFKTIQPSALKIITNSYTEKEVVQIINSLKDNPSYKGLQTYPCATVFQEEAIHQLVEGVGGKTLETDILERPLRTKTDRGNEVDMSTIVITSAR
ncbi:MAG: hypothetical protein HW387_1478 [Parachlamydiales bacterium]|nr:hypothetical protein [Parachlamydiales bacterium]